MNEIYDDKMFLQADGLRKALAKREGRLPKLSPDVNAHLMNQMNHARQKSQSVRLRWIWSVAVSVVILILSVAVWTLKQSDGLMTSANQESRQQSIWKEEHHRKVCGIAYNEREQIHPQVKQKVEEKVAISKNTKEKDATGEDSIASEKPVELTADQMKMTNYIAQLTQLCQADTLFVDCGNIDGNMVYVFPDSKECDIFGRLSMVVLWLDVDKPSVKMAFSSNQMTLELEGENKTNSVNDIWLADKRNGLVCLYHAQSRKEEQNWLSASCYMNFLAGNQSDRTGKMYKEDY